MVRRLEGHRAVTCSVSFHPSTHADAMLLSASIDGTVRVWETTAPEAGGEEKRPAGRDVDEGHEEGVLPLGEVSKLPFGRGAS